MISKESEARIRHSFFETIRRSKTPTVFCMAGIPGSGKSTFVNQSIDSGEFSSNAFILDPDRVMLALPEYQHDYEQHGQEFAFSQWEIPSRHLAYAMFDDAVSARMDIIKDMGCARMENYEMLKAVKATGYKLRMYYMDCPVEVALARITSRPRHTPEAMVRERAQALRDLIPLYQALADDFRIITPGEPLKNPIAA